MRITLTGQVRGGGDAAGDTTEKKVLTRILRYGVKLINEGEK